MTTCRCCAKNVIRQSLISKMDSAELLSIRHEVIRDVFIIEKSYHGNSDTTNVVIMNIMAKMTRSNIGGQLCFGIKKQLMD